MHSGTFRDIQVHSGTVKYIQVHSGAFKYIQLHSSTFKYIQVHSRTFRDIQVHSDTAMHVCKYVRVYVSMSFEVCHVRKYVLFVCLFQLPTFVLAEHTFPFWRVHDGHVLDRSVYVVIALELSTVD